MKIIGVLGGLGPQATMDLEARIHAVSQSIRLGQSNEAYPPLVVYYHRDAPVQLTESGLPVVPFAPTNELLAAAKRLGEWADFLLICSNGVHRFVREIEEASGRPVLSMIDCVMDEIERRSWRRVGVLAYIDAGVYLDPLANHGLDGQTIDREMQARMDEAIPAYTSGRATSESSAAVRDAVAALRLRGVDGTILGCTELPLLLGNESEADDLINPLTLVAEAAVRRAMED